MPMREARKVWRTSTVPTVSSTCSGSSMPFMAARRSSMALVDDGVGADLDVLALGHRAGVAHRADVEAEDDRVRGRGQDDVGLGDAADAAVDTLTCTSSCGSRAISSSKASSEPETSALSTRLSSLTTPSLMPVKSSSKETLRPARRA